MSPHSRTTRRSRWRPTAARRREAHGFGGRREAHGLGVLAVHPAELAALLGIGARLTAREIGPGCKSLHPNPYAGRAARAAGPSRSTGCKCL